ncbi:thr operon leader peptide [Glaesserella parasuis]
MKKITVAVVTIITTITDTAVAAAITN